MSKLALNSESEVRETFNDMYNRLSKQYDVKGMLIERMVPPGLVELIVGLQTDSAVWTNYHGWIGWDIY